MPRLWLRCIWQREDPGRMLRRSGVADERIPLRAPVRRRRVCPRCVWLKSRRGLTSTRCVSPRRYAI